MILLLMIFLHVRYIVVMTGFTDGQFDTRKDYLAPEV